MVLSVRGSLRRSVRPSKWSDFLPKCSNSGASFDKERSGIDLDFRERSLTKRFVPARALSFVGL